MNLLMLTCLSIRSATETANANIKKALLGYFTINAKQLATGITEDTVEQILDIGGVSGRFTLRSNTYATYLNAEGELLEINTEGAAQVPEGFENAGKIVANSNSQNDSYFTDGGFELVEGKPITTQGGSQVLIHEKFPPEERAVRGRYHAAGKCGRCGADHPGDGGRDFHQYRGAGFHRHGPVHVDPQSEERNWNFTGSRYRQVCGHSSVHTGNYADRHRCFPTGVSVQQTGGEDAGNAVRQDCSQRHCHAAAFYDGSGCRRGSAACFDNGILYPSNPAEAEADFIANGIKQIAA